MTYSVEGYFRHSHLKEYFVDEDEKLVITQKLRLNYTPPP